jgi:hypothetical protein
MSRVIEAVVMPGGWHKPEKDRLGRDMPQPIRADTYKLLVQAVIKFRADNIIPIGDVEAEVEEYICSNFPHMCHHVPGATVAVTVTRQPSEIQSRTDRMLQWMSGQIQDHSAEKLVLRGEAQRRADICRKCPYNVRWHEGCGTCSEAVNRMSIILRSGHDTVNGRDLKSCQVLSHENRSAVWLPISSQDPNLPARCWAKA